VALITPILLSASAFGAYFLFGGLALFTVCVLALQMPETRGRSLESIQDAFQQPASSSLTRLLHLLRLGQPGQNTANTLDPNADEVELQTRNHGETTTTAMAASSVSLGPGARTSRLEIASA
jgi:hypothetical protein